MYDEAFGVPEWLEWGQRVKAGMNRTVISFWSYDNGRASSGLEGRC